MTNLLSSFMKDLVCAQDECLSWIIILINILTVFYLVFCAWFKVTKTVKVIGYVWASALTVGTVAVVAEHTCIFTILSAVFTALIVMAVLSVVFDKGVFERVDTEEKTVKPFGSYVIHKTDKNNYVFVIYDNKKKALAKSCDVYESIYDAKAAIELCRKNGYIAAVEDKTRKWIEFVNHPKFELKKDGEKYYFTMSLTDETVIIKSDIFDDHEQCEKALKAAISAVISEKTYYSEYEVLAEKQSAKKSEIKEQPAPTAVKEEPKAVAAAEVKEPVIAVKEEPKAVAIKEEKPVLPREITLKEAFEIAVPINRKSAINKQFVSDYLKERFGAEVEVNCRANYTRTGKLSTSDTNYLIATNVDDALAADSQYVLAADACYVVSGKKKTCFAFVYEVNNTILLLLKVSSALGNKFAEGRSTVNLTKFSETKDTWYSVIVDDSFTDKDVKEVLAESVLYTKEK